MIDEGSRRVLVLRVSSTRSEYYVPMSMDLTCKILRASGWLLMCTASALTSALTIDTVHTARYRRLTVNSSVPALVAPSESRAALRRAMTRKITLTSTASVHPSVTASASASRVSS